MSRTRAPRRVTRGVLHVGTLLGGALLLVALVLEVMGPGDAGVVVTGRSLVDVSAIMSGIAKLDPWAWSAVGVWVVIVTPGLALVTTAVEFRTIGDRWAVGATACTLALLVLSFVVGLVRGS